MCTQMPHAKQTLTVRGQTVSNTLHSTLRETGGEIERERERETGGEIEIDGEGNTSVVHPEHRVSHPQHCTVVHQYTEPTHKPHKQICS